MSDTSKKYRTCSVKESYKVEDKDTAIKVFDILSKLHLDDLGKSELQLLADVCVDTTWDRPTYNPDIGFCISDTGLNFIFIYSDSFNGAIVYTKGIYMIRLAYSTADLFSLLDEVDNYSSHVYHINKLIKNIQEVFNS